MGKAIGLAALCLAATLAVAAGPAQQGPPQAPKVLSVASVLDFNLSVAEREIVSAAEAMPEAKYDFVPTTGEFKGVRSFAQQVRHIAYTNNIYYNAILGQAPPPNVSLGEGVNGPDSIATKAQLLQYLRDSFALGHRAIATITAENQLTPVAHPPVSFLTTPLALASWGPGHAFDHYGQMVEYLRMNGIVPPASQNSPPANPQGLQVK